MLVNCIVWLNECVDNVLLCPVYGTTGVVPGHVTPWLQLII